MIVIGIDPGAKGGFICLDENHQIIDFLPMPMVGREVDIITLRSWLTSQNYTDSNVFIEHSQAIHKCSAGSTFTFGKNFGILLGVVATLSFSYSLVKPKTWQKVMFEGTDASDRPKSRAYAAALRRYPKFEFVPAGCRNPHEGLVDASLIAGYGMYKLRGSQSIFELSA